MFPSVRSKNKHAAVNLHYLTFSKKLYYVFGHLVLAARLEMTKIILALIVWFLVHQHTFVALFSHSRWLLRIWAAVVVRVALKVGKLCCCYSRCPGASRSPWHLASVTVVTASPLELASTEPGTSLSSLINIFMPLWDPNVNWQIINICLSINVCIFFWIYYLLVFV